MRSLPPLWIKHMIWVQYMHRLFIRFAIYRFRFGNEYAYIVVDWEWTPDVYTYLDWALTRAKNRSIIWALAELKSSSNLKLFDVFFLLLLLSQPLSHSVTHYIFTIPKRVVQHDTNAICGYIASLIDSLTSDVEARTLFEYDSKHELVALVLFSVFRCFGILWLFARWPLVRSKI